MNIEELIHAIQNHEYAYSIITIAIKPSFRITESEMNLLKHYSIHLICKECRDDKFCDQHEKAKIANYMGVDLELVGDIINES